MTAAGLTIRRCGAPGYRRDERMVRYVKALGPETA